MRLFLGILIFQSTHLLQRNLSNICLLLLVITLYTCDIYSTFYLHLKGRKRILEESANEIDVLGVDNYLIFMIGRFLGHICYKAYKKIFDKSSINIPK